MDYESGLIGDEVNEHVADVDKKTFTLPIEKLDTDFKKDYPPDALGAEMGEGARVWKVYRDQAIEHDNAMLDGWSKTLDILLIFAGLFSAVATAFVVESAKLLQPDNEAYMATALYLLVNASSASATKSLPVPPSLETSVTSLSRWINGLWFTSLLLSLTVALISILVKQWIGEYISRNVASAESRRHWARRRQLYFHALTTWPVAYLVSLLPLMLHISLFLFIGGIVCYLWSLDRAIGIWFIVLGSVLIVFYLACTLIPIWKPESPTHTPLVNQMRGVWVTAQILSLRGSIVVTEEFLRCAASLQRKMHLLLQKRSEVDVESLSRSRTRLRFTESLFITRCRHAVTRLNAQRTDQALLKEVLSSRKDDLDIDVLEWLISSVSNSDAVAVGLQAVGALHPDSSQAVELRARGRLGQITARRALTGTTTSRWNPVEVTRVVRSMLCMRVLPRSLAHGFGEIFDIPLPEDDYPDIALIFTVMAAFRNGQLFLNGTRWRDGSPTTTSTCLLLMRLPGLQASELMMLLPCCRWEELSESDWIHIARAFVERGRRFGSSLAQAQKSPKRLWLADVIAELSLHGRIYPRQELLIVAQRLIDDLLSGTSLGAVTKSDHLRDYPFLWDFLASKNFLHVHHDMQVLAKVAKLLTHRSARACNNAPTMRLCRVAAAVMHVALEHPTSLTSLLLEDISWFLAHSFMLDSNEHVEASPLQPLRSISALMHFMLRPNALPVLQQSLWSMMPRELYTSSSSVLYVDRVASALCCLTRAREDGTEDMSRHFFEILQCGELLRWSAIWWDSEQDLSQDGVREFVRIVQHGMQLRSSWWTDGLASMRSEADDAEPRTKEFAVLVDNEVSRIGPCKYCLPDSAA